MTLGRETGPAAGRQALRPPLGCAVVDRYSDMGISQLRTLSPGGAASGSEGEQGWVDRVSLGCCCRLVISSADPPTDTQSSSHSNETSQARLLGNISAGKDQFHI